MLKPGNKYKLLWVLQVLFESIFHSNLNYNKMAVKRTKTNQRTYSK